jgi:hypothetical protein
MEKDMYAVVIYFSVYNARALAYLAMDYPVASAEERAVNEKYHHQH